MKNFKYHKKYLKIAPLAAMLFLLNLTTIYAQSTILSLPSTDALKKGSVGLRLVGKFKVNDQEAKKKFLSLTPRFYVGVGKNVEVGLNLLGNVQPGKDSTTLVPTVKWRFYSNEKYGVAAAGGTHFYVPVRNKKYDFGTYNYLVMSKSFKSGTRLTAGSYYFSQNVVAKNASRGGVQFGFEQKINKKAAFAAEWMSGRHSNGNLTAALKFKFNRHISTNAGYIIANDKSVQGNHYFYTSFGYNF